MCVGPHFRSHSSTPSTPNQFHRNLAYQWAVVSLEDPFSVSLIDVEFQSNLPNQACVCVSCFVQIAAPNQAPISTLLFIFRQNQHNHAQVETAPVSMIGHLRQTELCARRMSHRKIAENHNGICTVALSGWGLFLGIYTKPPTFSVL